MNAAQQDEYIVQALRMQGAMYEDDARKFLAEHDDRVRATALAEAMRLIDEHPHPGDNPARFYSELLTSLLPGGEKATAAAATATPDSAAPDFFQPGRSYLVDGHEYRCRTVDTHPVKQEREAWGWFHRGDDRWQHRRFYDTEYTRATPYAGEVGCG